MEKAKLVQGRKSKFKKDLYIPALRKIFMFDILVFLSVFFMTLFANFRKRSIQFNLVISATFLLKCLITGTYRFQKSFKTLRRLMVIRYLTDSVLILPVVLYFHHETQAYIYNLLIVLLILVFSELILFLQHFPSLYTKTKLECVE